MSQHSQAVNNQNNKKKKQQNKNKAGHQINITKTIYHNYIIFVHILSHITL